jgi:hypothetical protein
VPLRRGEPDAVLNLQPMLDHGYQSGRHDDIDYTKPADPPLENDAAAWADDLLRKAGLRT